MQHVTECDEHTLTILQKVLRKVAIGKAVSFHVEAGMHRVEDGGRVVAAPNGTVTFTVLVNGGAQDTGLPDPKSVEERMKVWR
jgi:hypothetical protein